ncbi:hypothetical protein AB0J35_29385 [Nonomuraea angiospora]|uniref:hypothetical protein n=1 Tax=Nonomuraea angiospora TaxID=46172 RepID=UPI003425121C
MTYTDAVTVRRGGLTFDLVHAKGETDDGTICYVREHKLLLPGDLFLWVTPNCGNPQKAQRYPRGWVHLAALAAPDDAGVHRVRAEVFSARAAGELSLMAKGIFAWAAAESRKRS